MLKKTNNQIMEGGRRRSFFVAMVTTYIDSYKARGEDWATNHGPMVFATRDEADAFVSKHVWPKICDREFTKEEKDECELPLDYDKKRDVYRIPKDKKGTCSEYADWIESAALNEGEFVPCTFTTLVLEWVMLEDGSVKEPWQLAEEEPAAKKSKQ